MRIQEITAPWLIAHVKDYFIGLEHTEVAPPPQIDKSVIEKQQLKRCPFAHCNIIIT